MTPKEKAEELVIKFMKHSFHQGSLSQCRDHAKQCALIAVDEIIKFMSDDPYYRKYKFFEQVKTEIEKL